MKTVLPIYYGLFTIICQNGGILGGNGGGLFRNQ
jgi:ubiquitin C-terminal hydrolase